MKNISVYITSIALLFLATGCKDVLEEDIEDATITVLSPADHYHSTTKNVNFLWEPVEGADQYVVKIVSPDFTSTTEILLDTTMAATSYTYLFPRLGVYKWSLQAQNFGYQTDMIIERTIHIDSLNVTIDTIAPAAPELVLPYHCDTLYNDTVDFIWLNSGSDFDSIFIYSDSATALLFSLDRSTNQKYELIDSDSTTYYWNVRSYDIAGNKSTLSETRKIVLR